MAFRHNEDFNSFQTNAMRTLYAYLKIKYCKHVNAWWKYQVHFAIYSKMDISAKVLWQRTKPEDIVSPCWSAIK